MATATPSHGIRSRAAALGTRCSLVSVVDVPHLLATVTPPVSGCFEEEADEVLVRWHSLLASENLAGKVAAQTVFLRDPTDLPACQRLMREFYGGYHPATTYLPQPPCCGASIVLEALVLADDRHAFVEHCDEHLTILNYRTHALVYESHMTPGGANGRVYPRSRRVLARLRDLLGSHQVGLHQVMRTWFYLGDIVGPDGDTQRYLELNRARADCYESVHFGEGYTPPDLHGPMYPASTGIGTGGDELVVSCLALQASPEVVSLVPLENPNQTPAFAYGRHYSPKSPKFCRALAAATDESVTIFVSGTASITNSETRWVGDVGRQTEQTLDNIAALVGHDNLARHGLAGAGVELKDLAGVRVYVKRRENYSLVRSVCESRLGSMPAVYVVADVCRPDLLVEIEALAASPRK